MDTICNASFRNFLLEVKLIGSAIDNISLRNILKQLTQDYIENQIVHCPNSMNGSKTFIVIAKRIFYDTIIQS